MLNHGGRGRLIIEQREESTYCCDVVTLCDVVMVGCTWPRDVGGQRAVAVSRGQGSRACRK